MKETNSNPAHAQRRVEDASHGRANYTNGTNDPDKRHALVVSLLSMLQAPAASVVVPTFGDRNS